MKRPFSGGVHPAGSKEASLSADSPPLLRPERVVIPLRQHIGAPCQPLVRTGDRVRLGQKIGDGEGLCVPIHASVSGTVIGIEDAPHPTGGCVPAVIMENDGQDTLDDGLAPHPSPERLTAEELSAILREAGIVGMGGATFPTHVKVASSAGKLGTLILNACECEPYITADDTLLRTQPDRVLQGIQLLARTLGAKRTVLALEDNKPQAIQVLNQHLSGDSGIELQVLPTRYPQGAEKQLIQAVTGLEVLPGKLPADLGCAVFNVSTVAAIAQAVFEGLPLVRRIVTVTGEGVRRPGNFLVPIGTPFSVLIQQAGGLTAPTCRVIAGGPMMGLIQSTPEVPVVKGTGCVLCLPDAAMEEHPRCIRCGKCVLACPVHLQPLYLYRYGEKPDFSALERLHLTDCMECGCCSYVCPGKLPLVERFRIAKRALKEAKTG